MATRAVAAGASTAASEAVRRALTPMKWSREVSCGRSAGMHSQALAGDRATDKARRIVRISKPGEEPVYALQALTGGGGLAEKNLRILRGEIFEPETLEPTGEVVQVGVGEDDFRILAPLSPPIVLGTGLNYRRHAEECGLAIPKVPVLAFFKQSTAVQHPELPITIPRVCEGEPEVDWEVELAVVIKKLCKSVSPADAMEYVLGFTAANDISARRWQTDPDLSAGQWNKGKGFDTFCPLGPALVLNEAGFDPHNLDVKLEVNGVQKQSSNTSDLIFSVPEIVSFLSQDTSLLPGTVILTGTPEGIGMFRSPPEYLSPGDVVAVSVEGIGTLTNPVTSSDVAL